MTTRKNIILLTDLISAGWLITSIIWPRFWILAVAAVFFADSYLLRRLWKDDIKETD